MLAGPPMERVTPTGAALLRMLDVQYAPLPAMRVSVIGLRRRRARHARRAELLRLLVGEEAAADSAVEPIAIMETVIDDSSPQLIAYVSELLLEAGAWDVYRMPVQMKKGRTGVQLTVLCHPDKVPAMRDLDVSRDHNHRHALAHREQSLAGAGVQGSADASGVRCA